MAKVVLKDFYADWCPPCRMLKPVIEELEKEFKGKVEFKNINVDEDKTDAMKYGVRSIPTIVIEKDGKMVESFIGVQTKTALKNVLDKLVK
ncbi:MAG: thioredoxin [Nanoarchaeota archaeon]|nr:thioredoxin [Nanoarchaeota archaeon]